MNNGDFSLTINIDIDHLARDVKKFAQMEDAIITGMAKGETEFGDRLRAKAIEYLGIYELGNSTLASTISVTPNSMGMKIMVQGDYAMFVEYGTGIIGRDESHPKPDGWAYDVNEHGEAGWIYPKDDGTFGWTRGMPSRPFMYMTWLWGRRSVVQIINKNIRRELKKVKGMK